MPSGRPSATVRSRGFPPSPPRTAAPSCSVDPTGPGPSRRRGRPECGRHVRPSVAPTRPDPVREAALPRRRPTRPVSRASADPEAPPPALARAPEGPAAVPALAPGPAVVRRAWWSRPREAARRAPREDHAGRARRRRPPAGAGQEGLTGGACDRRASAAEARPTSPAIVDRVPVPELRPGGDPVAQPAVVPAPAPLPDAGAGRAAQPAPPLTLAAAHARRARVLGGSRGAARLHQRTEVRRGTDLDGETVVEQITPDGAVLRQQGKRIVLRPKLNPYAPRPGSP